MIDRATLNYVGPAATDQPRPAASVGVRRCSATGITMDRQRDYTRPAGSCKLALASRPCRSKMLTLCGGVLVVGAEVTHCSASSPETSRFDLFDKAGQIIVKAAETYAQLGRDYSTDDHLARIRQLEHDGDDIAHRTLIAWIRASSRL